MIGEALGLLLDGFAKIGDGFTLLLSAFFNIFGLQVPEVVIRVVVLLFTALFVWKLFRRLPKIVVVLMLVVFASVLTGIFL